GLASRLQRRRSMVWGTCLEPAQRLHGYQIVRDRSPPATRQPRAPLLRSTVAAPVVRELRRVMHGLRTPSDDCLLGPASGSRRLRTLSAAGILPLPTARAIPYVHRPRAHPAAAARSRSSSRRAVGHPEL